MSLGGQTSPCDRCPRIQNGNDHLTVDPEPRLLRELKALDDTKVGARIMRGMHPDVKLRHDAKGMVRITSRLASVYLAIVGEPGSSIVLLEADVQKILFGIVLDSTRYDLRKRSDGVNGRVDEVDYDAVVSLKFKSQDQRPLTFPPVPFARFPPPIYALRAGCRGAPSRVV